MLERRFDSTNKTSWSPENAPIIADRFGFILDDLFRQAIERFYNDHVLPARITNFLAPIAQGYLSSYQPPLTKKA